MRNLTCNFIRNIPQKDVYVIIQNYIIQKLRISPLFLCASWPLQFLPIGGGPPSFERPPLSVCFRKFRLCYFQKKKKSPSPACPRPPFDLFASASPRPRAAPELRRGGELPAAQETGGTRTGERRCPRSRANTARRTPASSTRQEPASGPHPRLLTTPPPKIAGKAHAQEGWCGGSGTSGLDPASSDLKVAGKPLPVGTA